MTDGAATLMTSIYGMFGGDLHMGERGTNLLDSVIRNAGYAAT
jgi:hypothetical protein